MTEKLLKLIEKGQLKKIQALIEDRLPSPRELGAGLCMAALFEHPAIVHFLIGNGADVNFRYNENWRPLHYAARGHDRSIVEYLIFHGAELEPLNDYGRAPLMEAAMTGDLSILKVLLEKGADVNRTARVGICALSEAAWNSRPDAVILLLGHGADKTVLLRDGSTLLDWATRNGHSEIVEMLTGSIDSKDKFDFGNSMIHASRRGDVDVILSLLEKGANINCTDREGNTPLMVAASGSLDAVVLLLSHGANPYVLNKYSKSAFSEAAKAGRKEIVTFLMDKGLSFYSRTDTGESPLIEACLKGDASIVERLIDHPDIQINRQSDTYNRSTALTLAARIQKVSVIEKLLSHGADMFVPDKNGLHAAHYALLSGDISLIKLFETYGLKPERVFLAEKNALMLAVSGMFQVKKSKTLFETIAWLIKKGVDTRQKDHDGITALMMAVPMARADILTLLIRSGDELEAEDASGRTPLLIAVAHGAQDDRYVRPKTREEDPMGPVVDCLLENGADPAHGPVLFYACRLRCADVVEKLIAYGADVNQRTASGGTPLMGVSDNLKAARILVEHGADIHARDDGGRTALHHISSAYRDVSEVVSFLVKKGADINSKDHSGRTPFLSACRTNQTDTVEKLIKLGADLTCVDMEGKGALDLARASCQEYMIETLKRYGRFSSE